MPTRKTGLFFLASVLVVLSIHGDPPVNMAKNTRIALGGYDAVAYFTVGKPLKGDRSLSHEWQGAVWQFASRAHRDLFIRTPERYAPQYGGYCAFGMSRGYAAPVDPLAWKVIEGRLYLNYNAVVQKAWARDIAGHVIKANRNWPKVRGK